MTRLIRIASLALPFLLIASSAYSDTVDDIAQRRTMNIGYRTDAPPFSTLDSTNRPAGFAIELCQRIVDAVGKATGKPIAPVFVPVSASDRFDALEKKKIDILCGPTTVTLKRREQVDFTLFTFVTGGTLMIRAKSEPPDMESGANPKIGVLANTTSEAALKRLVDTRQLKIEIVPVDTHDIAIGLLNSGVLDGYFADRDLLWDRKNNAADPSAFAIAENLLTYEPYALAVPRGEDRLRLISDRTLAELYRSGEIFKLIERWFPGARPSNLLTALYFIQSLDD
jgi:polar amino acid transport system substrate-binding protein/glutamate/aspartate transport system substrate-binding protein